jgi:putative phosphoesterase
MTENKFRIGVISDTHGRLDESVLEKFAGVYRIIHAGDVGDEKILWDLEAIAPVIAVKGNNDSDLLMAPKERLAVIGNVNLFVVHEFAKAEDLTDLQKKLIEERMLDVVIFGHSHKAYQGNWRGTLLYNPGSAGPKRFNLPRSIGFLEIEAGEVRAEVMELDAEPRWV